MKKKFYEMMEDIKGKNMASFKSVNTTFNNDCNNFDVNNVLENSLLLYVHTVWELKMLEKSPKFTF